LCADWQRQLTIAHRECGFEYIRMHGLFTDDMAVYRDYGKPEYNWQYVDELYDFLHSIGMKPFVELGFMPEGLASGSKTIFWWKGNVTPPKDMNKWADLIRAFVVHERERYGDAEVRTWYCDGPRHQECFAGLQSGRPGHGGLRLDHGVPSFLRHEPRAGGFRFHAHLRRGERLPG
jgi:beta-xylosidase